MVLSWNEIKERAIYFFKEWADTANEEADAKPFLVEFFTVFGISSKQVGQSSRLGFQTISLYQRSQTNGVFI